MAMRNQRFQGESLKAIAWGMALTALLGATIVAGSRNLDHFDAALVGYTFATLFATFGVTYRYAMWLQRPTTAIYWRRGWQFFLKPKYLARNLVSWVRHVIADFGLNQFVFKRGALRGSAHWLIMWGCLIAVAITFPLVFGWVHFETLPDNFEWYQAFVFGFPAFAFPIHSVFAFLVFHGLVWASILVTVGVMLAMRRRMKEHGAAAVQQFGEDFLPLILLFAVSISGLMLTASYTWMHGYAYDFIAIFHAITVIFTLLWLPFGKFFHIFQRPAMLGVQFYKEVGQREAQATCRRCAHPFTSEVHVLDLIRAQRELGYRYELDGESDARSEKPHYAWVCPPCRRSMFAIAQGAMWADELPMQVVPFGDADRPLPGARYVNDGENSGPLGDEDRRNYHP
ncbi:MAG: MFS transporter [Blastocatellia bacterium]